MVCTVWVVGGGGDGGRGSVGLGDGVGGERGSSGENPPRHGEGGLEAAELTELLTPLLL